MEKVYSKIIKGVKVTFIGNKIYRNGSWSIKILCIVCSKPKIAHYHTLVMYGEGMKHAKCTARIHAKNRTIVEEAVVNAIFLDYKNHIKYRRKRHKISFELTLSQFRKLILSPCYYCGGFSGNLVKVYKIQSIEVNGIDRLDNDLGYTMENSVPCCTICNHAKNILSYDKFMEWVNRVTLYNIASVMPMNNKIIQPVEYIN